MIQQAESNPTQDLVASLTREFESSDKAAGVLQLLERYPKGHEHWQQYAHFGPDTYTRNLIARTNRYDLMILCWGKGQVSPIHNHAGQRCWMTVLEGAIEETFFHLHEGSSSNRIERGDSREYDVGVVGYITDDIALHVIGAARNAPAISLHLYSLPYDECNIYDPDSGEITPKQLFFHTVDGQLVDSDASEGPA